MNGEAHHEVWREALWCSAGKDQMALWGSGPRMQDGEIGHGAGGHWLCIQRRDEIGEETLGLEEERSGSLRLITSGSLSGAVCDTPAMMLGLSLLQSPSLLSSEPTSGWISPLTCRNSQPLLSLGQWVTCPGRGEGGGYGFGQKGPKLGGR